MSSTDRLPTDVVLLRVPCPQAELPALAARLAQGFAGGGPLGARLFKSAWAAAAGMAYVYLRLPQRMALPLGEVAGLAATAGDAQPVQVARLAWMHDVPGVSAGCAARFHYVVEMTPEASWEVELQRWYDTEHLPGLAGVPGCVHAWRFWNYDEGPQSVACYDLLDAQALESPAWLAVRHTAWSARMRPRFTHTVRTLFTLLA